MSCKPHLGLFLQLPLQFLNVLCERGLATAQLVDEGLLLLQQPTQLPCVQTEPNQPFWGLNAAICISPHTHQSLWPSAAWRPPAVPAVFPPRQAGSHGQRCMPAAKGEVRQLGTPPSDARDHDISPSTTSITIEVLFRYGTSARPERRHKTDIPLPTTPNGAPANLLLSVGEAGQPARLNHGCHPHLPFSVCSLPRCVLTSVSCRCNSSTLDLASLSWSS